MLMENSVDLISGLLIILKKYSHCALIRSNVVIVLIKSVIPYHLASDKVKTTVKPVLSGHSK